MLSPRCDCTENPLLPTQRTDRFPFPLLPLPYAYDALCPALSGETLCFHHDKHLKTYVDNLNDALRPWPRYHNWPLERLLRSARALPPELRVKIINNGGGVYNHNLYFAGMKSPEEEPLGPVGALKTAIEQTFGGYEGFQNAFTESASEVFGSGWTWLVCGGESSGGGLRILNTANQDTPLAAGACPILLLDLWEHAYYLDYQNRRKDYVKNWFSLISWERANNRYLLCCSQC